MLTRKLIYTATERYQIPIEDIVIDPLAMPAGADTGNTMRTLETLALIREEFGVNTTCGASNLSFGMPDRHALTRRVPAGRGGARADERHHGRTHAAGGHRRQGRRPAARPRRLGCRLDRRVPRQRRRPLRDVSDARMPGQAGHEPAGSTCGSTTAPVRVPLGVTLFDAASWNGIAIDSTCGGHGTCKKCRIRCQGRPAVPPASTCAPSRAEEIEDGWRLACRAPATTDAGHRGAAADHPAQGGDRRGGPPGHPPPAVIKRYLELAEPTLTDQAPTWSGYSPN